MFLPVVPITAPPPGVAVRRGDGVKLVYSAVNDSAIICRLMNDEKVTHSAGVPTVWLGMLQHVDTTGIKHRNISI